MNVDLALVLVALAFGLGAVAGIVWTADHRTMPPAKPAEPTLPDFDAVMVRLRIYQQYRITAMKPRHLLRDLEHRVTVN